MNDQLVNEMVTAFPVETPSAADSVAEVLGEGAKEDSDKIVEPPSEMSGYKADDLKGSHGEHFLSDPFMVAVALLEYTTRDTNEILLKSLAASLRHCQLHDLILGPQKSNGKYTLYSGHRRVAASDLCGIEHLRARVYTGPHSDALSVAENVQRKAESPRSLIARIRCAFRNNGTDKKTIKKIRQVVGAETGIKKSSIHYLVMGALLDEDNYQQVIASDNVIQAVRDLRKKRKLELSHQKRQTPGTTDNAPESKTNSDFKESTNGVDTDQHSDAGHDRGVDDDETDSTPGDKRAAHAPGEWFVADQIQVRLADVAVDSEEKALAGSWILTLACLAESQDVPIFCPLIQRAAETLARRMK
jgi:ParB-like nuclease domain